MSKQLYFKHFSLALVSSLNIKTVLFQVIQFSISMQYSSFWHINRTLSGATTPGQSGPWSDGNEEVLHIPQSSCIPGTSPSNCFVSYPGHTFGGGLTPLQRCCRCCLQPQPTEQVLLTSICRKNMQNPLCISYGRAKWFDSGIRSLLFRLEQVSRWLNCVWFLKVNIIVVCVDKVDNLFIFNSGWFLNSDFSRDYDLSYKLLIIKDISDVFYMKWDRNSCTKAIQKLAIRSTDPSSHKE